MRDCARVFFCDSAYAPTMTCTYAHPHVHADARTGVATITICIAQVTMKLVHYALLVNKLWFGLACLENCANAEAMGSNPVETPKTFSRATSQLLKLRFNCDGHIFISLLLLL